MIVATGPSTLILTGETPAEALDLVTISAALEVNPSLRLSRLASILETMAERQTEITPLCAIRRELTSPVVLAGVDDGD